MTVDQVDAPKPLEAVKASPTRMLFHVSGTHEEGIAYMKHSGLLAGGGATLTPRVDIGTWYNGGEFLTFWYPPRGEVDRGREEAYISPKVPATPEIKSEMLRNLDNMKLGDDPEMEKWEKDSLRWITNRAKTYLPGERLRAIARIRPGIGGTKLEWIFPEDSHAFIRFYNENKDTLPARVREALDEMEIEFVDPELNKDILTQDIIKTYVEHNLSNLGAYHGYPKDTKEGLEGVIRTLEGGAFDDPVWERYRTMLISRFQRRIANLAEVEKA